MTLVPNMRKANCAKAMKTMPNMMKNAPTSGALRCSVPASCDMVLLKEMYLNSFTHEKNTQMATADLNIVPRYPRDVKSA